MSIKKSLAWLGTAQAVAVIVQFASSVVLARYLTPHEMGIFAVAAATMAMLSLFQRLGLSALIVREEVLTDAVSNTAFTINALMTISLSLVTAAASYAGSRFFGDEGVRRVLLVLAVTPLFGIFSFLPGANLERAARFRELALISIVTGVIAAAATIVLAVLGFSYMSIAYSQLISSGAFAAMLIVAGREHFMLVIGFAAWRRVASFGTQMLAVGGVSTASLRLSEIVLGRLLGLAALGLYSRASGLNNLLWSNIHVAVSRVLLVDYAEAHRRGIPLRDRYLQTVAIVTAILWPAFAGLAIIAQPFIILVYGKQWAPAIVPFVYLALSSMVLVAITMTWELFTATGQIRTQTRIEFIRAGISLSLFVGGCLISLRAAAVARLIDALISVLLYRPHINRMTGTSTRDYWRIYAQSALLTGVSVAPAGLMMISHPADGGPLPMLIASILGGMALWLAGLFALRHPLANEMMTTLNNRIPALARARRTPK